MSDRRDGIRESLEESLRHLSRAIVRLRGQDRHQEADGLTRQHDQLARAAEVALRPVRAVVS
jgi:hypothetical protein